MSTDETHRQNGGVSSEPGSASREVHQEVLPSEEDPREPRVEAEGTALFIYSNFKCVALFVCFTESLFSSLQSRFNRLDFNERTMNSLEDLFHVSFGLIQYFKQSTYDSEAFILTVHLSLDGSKVLGVLVRRHRTGLGVLCGPGVTAALPGS